MQIVRVIVWVLVLVGLLLFSAFNWDPVEVTIWQDIVVETKIPALVIVAFLLGLLPMWLIYRGSKWRLKRRIAALESSLHSNAIANDALRDAAATADDAEVASTEVTERPTSPPEPLRPVKPDEQAATDRQDRPVT